MTRHVCDVLMPHGSSGKFGENERGSGEFSEDGKKASAGPMVPERRQQA